MITEIGHSEQIDSQFYWRTLQCLRDDAAVLCGEARLLCEMSDDGEPAALSAREKLAYRREMLLVTARLMQVMGWALAQQSAIEARSNPDTRAKNWTLDRTLGANGAQDAAPFFPRFDELVEGSQRLYQRVVRLDNDLRGYVDEPAAAVTPVRKSASDL